MRLAATRRRVMAVGVAAVLDAERLVGLGRAGERVERCVGPVVEHRLERLADQRRLEVLGVVELGLAVGVVEPPGEHVDRAVVVDGAEHAVEVDRAVEEVPRHVALQRAQEHVDAEHVLAGRPGDVHEVLVAAEVERAEDELAVALGVGLGRLNVGHGHVGGPLRRRLVSAQADVGPALDGVVAEDGLQQDDARAPWRSCDRRRWRAAAPGARCAGRCGPSSCRPARHRRATEPSLSAGTAGASSLTSSMVTSPSMHSGNSSWAQVRHSLVPSARMTSSTYCMFLPTATFSHGLEELATSKMLENA